MSAGASGVGGTQTWQRAYAYGPVGTQRADSSVFNLEKRKDGFARCSDLKGSIFRAVH